ncbi:Choline trimethylamine-lyase activating enzyme [Sporomusa silvacetica DSM 10669]|uniref:Choline trimethylamine-lyase activating enzyme n=1 Tax=Sporomusa silvacetica DSM 10669 TaxID=1123289 RepID=A0ABZ3IS91_9FIRM|nr:glycyl-radical enzyme activating protein [Sporomusa silvacetica]OZC15303.1 4-hydroxyphenylacetate decarboxylase activating enzyme [Sporomusa silvacetica DSM 10669]
MEPNHKRSGYVFNIQQFSVHDGPGIRTIVFLKGCPLRCRWCSNPESQESKPELAYNQNKCIGIAACGRCLKACPHNALRQGEDDKPVALRDVCKRCSSCAGACPTTALHTFGQLMSIDDILEVVERDNVFFSRSGGGLTISGGEPLMQPDFTVELLQAAKRRRINTTMETSGYAKWQTLEQACHYLNTLIYDIKCLDSSRHREQTQQANNIILENFVRLTAAFPNLPILVRTPIIPGFNDSEEDITAIINFVKGRPNVGYELLPYHRLGQPKYEYLGKEYPLGNLTLREEQFARLNTVKSALDNPCLSKVTY